ncbi:MAG: NAD(P)-dependent glycerol-3-phosphate dehydrogenase [Planctomycetia bacterium]|nr:NAD(P)-dependent glycerol-3-phosphate dehydrogenase [Planctomycetia bacterium]
MKLRKIGKLAVIGDGAMGTACAIMAHARGIQEITLWSARAESGVELCKHRENKVLLPGIIIPDQITLTLDVENAIQDADLILVAVPTVYLRTTISRFVQQVSANTIPVLSVVKGLETGTLLRPSEIIETVWGKRPIAVLSGPCHAEEITRGKPTGLVVASIDGQLAKLVQESFHGDSIRIYTSNDIIGVELAAAVKNVIAIAAGISDGLNLGDNAKSALLTRALVEMMEFGMAHGADAQTFVGLAGLGDLITTCISPHGRNRSLGERLGKGETLDHILASTPKIAEGVTTAKSLYERCQELSLDMPIARSVYQVLYEHLVPRLAVKELLSREPKSEMLFDFIFKRP